MKYYRGNERFKALILILALGVSSCGKAPLSISREECLSVRTDNNYAFEEVSSYVERKTKWKVIRSYNEGGCKPTVYASIVIAPLKQNRYVLFSAYQTTVGYSVAMALYDPARGSIASGLAGRESLEKAIEKASESVFRTKYDDK